MTVYSTGSSAENPENAKGEGGPPPPSSIGPDPSEHNHHHCLIYGDRYEFESALRRFVLDGVRLDRRVLLIGGEGSLESTETMARVARSIDESLPSVDQVLFHSSYDVYRKNGEFDRYRALTFIRNQLRLAQHDGFRGLSLAQDLGSLAQNDGELKDIIAFEAGIGMLLSDVPRSILCLCHRHRSSPELLVACLDTHPTHLTDDRLRIAVNPFYRSEIALGTPPYEEVARERLDVLARLRRKEEFSPPPITSLLHRITRWTDEGETSAEAVLTGAVQDIGTYLDAGCGRALIVHHAKHLLVSNGPWIGTRGFHDPTRVVATLENPVSRGEGLSGRAWLTRRPVWTTTPGELTRSALPPQSFDAESGVAIPMICGGEVEAVLEFIFSNRREPNEGALADIESIARIIGEVLGRLRAREELNTERAKLLTLLKDTGEAIIITDHAGRIQSWNRRSAQLLGQSGIEIPVGRNVADFFPPQLYERVHDAIRIIASSGENAFGGSIELHFPRGVGVGLTGITLSSAASTGEGAVAIVLSAETREGASLKQGGASQASLSEHEADPLLILSSDLRWSGPAIVSANSAFCQMSGYAEADLLGRSIHSLTDPQLDPTSVDRMRDGFASGVPFDAEISFVRENGDPLLLIVDILPIRYSNGSIGHFIVNGKERLRDDTVAEVFRRADTDPLTGLANRFLFDKMLGRAMERGRKTPGLHFGVLFLDLDRFKQVNDTRGHVIGDQLLVAVARELEKAVRPGDVVARFGGDEFVVLVDLVAGLREVVNVAERVSERLAEPIELLGEVFSLSASIGIAVSDTGYSTIEEVLRDADLAMYQAKQEGGGRYKIFDAKLREGIAAANSVRTALQESLARGEFRLHYQPFVDLNSSRITGLEALLRWEHPERGTLSAKEFISLAEDTGLILPIGRWVIREACRQLASWQTQLGPEAALKLSVNLSSRELLSPELPGWIRKSLRETGADPSSLSIEIPESFLAGATQEIAVRFRQLRDLGILISIGDFGGGDFSLRQLHRFPIDLLKVDCRLFSEPSDTPGGSREPLVNERALRSILALAASLDVEVVASGVETQLQWDTLRRLSYSIGQGYLFSKPVEATGAQNLLRDALNDQTGGSPPG